MKRNKVSGQAVRQETRKRQANGQPANAATVAAELLGDTYYPVLYCQATDLYHQRKGRPF